MSQFEYLIPFVGIIYALSATDLLVSTHRLIIERKLIAFHAVPIVWACVAFLLIINGWWGFLDINKNIVLANAGQLFLLSLMPLLGFMIASMSLPHKIHQRQCLWKYFNSHKTPFYLCLATYLLLIPIILGYFEASIHLAQLIKHSVLALIILSLIWLKHWGWHLAVGGFCILSLIGTIFSQSIKL